VVPECAKVNKRLTEKIAENATYAFVMKYIKEQSSDSVSPIKSTLATV